MIEAFALARARLVLEAEKIGIGRFRLPMQRTEQHIVAVIENILRAIAVMEIHIENGNPRRTGIAKRLRGNRRIVQEAIAAIESSWAWWPGGRHSAKAARSPLGNRVSAP